MAKRKSKPMKMGECRKTKNGQTYCKTRQGVRFKSRRSSLSGSRSRSRGRSCQRYKRVPMKGTTGKVRRCAQFK